MVFFNRLHKLINIIVCSIHVILFQGIHWFPTTVAYRSTSTSTTTSGPLMDSFMLTEVALLYGLI